MSRCRPAQAALLTGRWPHQTGVYYNVGAPTIDPADALPNHLKAAGYASARQIKHLNRDIARLHHKLDRAELIIDAQKKLCVALGLPIADPTSEDE
jgi:arylsulfatase A-like enzyme